MYHCLALMQDKTAPWGYLHRDTGHAVRLLI